MSDFLRLPESSAIMDPYRLGFGLSRAFSSTTWVDAVGIGWVFGMAAILTIPALGMILILVSKGPKVRDFSFARVKTNSRLDNKAETRSGSI